MNKREKLIVFLLGLCLAGYFYFSYSEGKKAAQARATWLKEHPEYVLEQQKQAQAKESQEATPRVRTLEVVTNKPIVHVAQPTVPEKFVTLSNADVAVTFSTHGAVLKKACLKKYATHVGPISKENPPLEFDLHEAPLLALHVPNLSATSPWEVVSQTVDSVVLSNQFVSRTLTLTNAYQIHVEEKFAPALVKEAQGVETGLGLSFVSQADEATAGGLTGASLTIDAFDLGQKKVLHAADEKAFAGLFSGSAGGCSSAPNPTGRPEVSAPVRQDGAVAWLAVKNRFFMSALVHSSQTNVGYSATVRRDLNAKDTTGREVYRVKSVSSSLHFIGLDPVRTYTLFVGPKIQSVVSDLDAPHDTKEVMEYGFWRSICYPTVWVMNFFYRLIPNYGVAIILLTILVRLLFWPLTHKSTVGMRKMQEIQPLMKEIQAKFKDNPQRLQQETWQLYREHKVNPLSSCLPMLVQIPIFIALFSVLRSAVELRYASFLWISDLSEPEGLFKAWFPFGGLNILPILMALLTMAQSAFTPSTGDNKQQRMMMIMMPLVMLVMFYNFASALSLYWALSTAFGVLQSWWIKKRYGGKK